MEQAKRSEVQEQFLDIMRRSKVGARGYKTFALLKQYGIQTLAMDNDGTTKGLIQALRSYEFSGQRVAIQLHGEPMPELISFFERQGAVVRTMLPYQHVAPDPEMSHQLCQEIVDSSVEAVCFTTAVQVRYFFQYVKNHGFYAEISKSFCHQVLATAVGRVTAEALKEEGIKRILVPENERMGAMIIELANHYRNTTISREEW